MGWAAPCCSSAIWKVNTMAMLERTGGSGCRLSRRSGWRHFCAQREGHTAPTPCEAGGQTARARACPERPPRPRGSDVTGGLEAGSAGRAPSWPNMAAVRGAPGAPATDAQPLRRPLHFAARGLGEAGSWDTGREAGPPGCVPSPPTAWCPAWEDRERWVSPGHGRATAGSRQGRHHGT